MIFKIPWNLRQIINIKKYLFWIQVIKLGLFLVYYKSPEIKYNKFQKILNDVDIYIFYSATKALSYKTWKKFEFYII